MIKKVAVHIISGFILLHLISSCQEPERKKTHFPNELQNTHWIINTGGLIAPDGDSIYYLSERIDSILLFNFHAIDFLDEERFRSYDSWECGNDCFTEVYGRYYFTEAKQIKMEVDSIRTSGTCMAPTQIFKPSKNRTFDLAKEGQQLKLTSK